MTAQKTLGSLQRTHTEPALSAEYDNGRGSFILLQRV